MLALGGLLLESAGKEGLEANVCAQLCASEEGARRWQHQSRRQRQPQGKGKVGGRATRAGQLGEGQKGREGR